MQGYVYDAKLRIAEIAREIWRDDALAEKLESGAATLRSRFDEAFWLEERGFYALGLDREKRPVDSLTSNLGHLLWSGIVPEQRREAIADLLLGDALWSGWGVRTMAAGEGAYNPLVYHDGTVWPHDNSLVAWGLAQSGRTQDAARILHAMVEAASHFDYRLPEVFAGFARRRHRFPGRVSHGLVAASVGGGDSGPPAAGGTSPRTRSCPACASLRGVVRARVARGSLAHGRQRIRPALDGACREWSGERRAGLGVVLESRRV